MKYLIIFFLFIGSTLGAFDKVLTEKLIKNNNWNKDNVILLLHSNNKLDMSKVNDKVINIMQDYIKKCSLKKYKKCSIATIPQIYALTDFNSVQEISKSVSYLTKLANSIGDKEVDNIINKQDINSLEEFLKITDWNLNSLNLFFKSIDIKYDILDEKSKNMIKDTLRNCSKSKYLDCISLNSMKLAQYLQDETKADLIDFRIKSLLKYAEEQRKSIIKQINEQNKLKREQDNKEQEKRLLLSKQQKQKEANTLKNIIISQGYKGIHTITDLFNSLQTTISKDQLKQYIYKASNNFQFIQIVDKYVVYGCFLQNEAIYITVPKEKRIYSKNDYIWGETFTFNGIQEFQSSNGIVQTIFLQPKTIYIKR